jgi:hypothetical protein
MDAKLSAGDWFFGKVLHMGANWESTVSGVGAAIFFILTTISTISLQFGDLLSLFSSSTKKDVAIASAIATGLLKGWNALVQKSRSVTGGNTQQTADGKLVKPGEQNLVDATVSAPPA